MQYGVHPIAAEADERIDIWIGGNARLLKVSGAHVRAGGFGYFGARQVIWVRSSTLFRSGQCISSWAWIVWTTRYGLPNSPHGWWCSPRFCVAPLAEARLAWRSGSSCAGDSSA